jgi:hypothetical protein
MSLSTLKKPIQPISDSEKCVFVFDWDDTLFPSTWIQKIPEGKQYFSEGFNFRISTPSLDQRLRDYEVNCAQLLTAALREGPVFIITNAQAGWVEHCVQKYVPNLAPIIARITVYSARSLYEGQYKTPEEWKLVAFRKLLGVSADGTPECVAPSVVFEDDVSECVAPSVVFEDDVSECVAPIRFISIGDSNSERQAAWSATGLPSSEKRTVNGIQISAHNPRFSTRSIKLDHFPTLDKLSQQLFEVNEYFAEVISQPDELDLVLMLMPKNP